MCYRHMFQNSDAVFLLSNLCKLVYSSSDGVADELVSVQNLHQMALSHSQFLPVMLESAIQNTVKGKH